MSFNARVLRKRANKLTQIWDTLTRVEHRTEAKNYSQDFMSDLTVAKSNICDEIKDIQYLIHKELKVQIRRRRALCGRVPYLTVQHSNMSASHIRLEQDIDLHQSAIEGVDNSVNKLVDKMVADLKYKCDECSTVYPSLPRMECAICGSRSGFTTITYPEYAKALDNYQGYDAAKVKRDAEGLSALFG